MSVALKQLYQVQQIVGHSITDGKYLYRIKWRNYQSHLNTWQPAQHLSPQLVQKYHIQQRQKIKSHSIRFLKKYSTYRPQIDIQIVHRRKNQNFIVRCGQKMESIDRDTLYENYPRMLAKFYGGLYNKREEREREGRGEDGVDSSMNSFNSFNSMLLDFTESVSVGNDNLG